VSVNHEQISIREALESAKNRILTIDQDNGG
jgi:hypothetical protein